MMRLVSHVVHMEERKTTYKILDSNPDEKRPIRRNFGMDGRIILEFTV